MANLVCMELPALYPAFATALCRVCETIDWDYGEVWTPISEMTLLELSPVWYGHQNRSRDRLNDLEQFRACSEDFVLAIDEGLPGRIWRSQQVNWINDVSVQSEQYFLRNHLAKAFNLKAGFGFPVFHKQTVVGIFVFFTASVWELDHDLIQRAMTATNSLEYPELYTV